MKIQETPWESRRLQLLCIMTDGHKRSENAEEGRRQLRLTLALVLHLVKNERGGGCNYTWAEKAIRVPHTNPFWEGDLVDT